MIELTITPDLERAPWVDLREAGKLERTPGRITRVGRLQRGTMKGKSTVAIVVELPDGKRYYAETTLALFLAAAEALKAAEEEASGANARN